MSLLPPSTLNHERSFKQYKSPITTTTSHHRIRLLLLLLLLLLLNLTSYIYNTVSPNIPCFCFCCCSLHGFDVLIMAEVHFQDAGPKRNSSLVVCFGEMLIDFVPTVGGVSLAEAPAFKKAPGGAPANVAVCIARLDGSSAFIGKLGDDEFGHMLSNILKQNNVDNSGVRFDPNARTALAFVTLRADGEREFLFFRHPSADMLLRESELSINLLEQAKIFHYGSISLISEPCRSAHLAAMKIAKKSGSILSYDPNLRLALWPSAEAARKEIMGIWDQADVIKISEEEITFLTGGEDPSDDNVVLKKLFHPNLKLLIVTEGSEGCRYYTKEFKGRVAGVKVKPVDTTGAGDAFVGGILSKLASDTDLFKDEKRLRVALLFANACGAVTVTERGAIPALPTKEAVLELLRKSLLIDEIEQESLKCVPA
ncbi:hypothetical protein K2173_026690 [Erythroxylum novogranatense]|uniref:fructokinase n=1 Tax=Erythroxylum novogranatense TaxID=1862640 RepID=A0AAV8U0Q7_9ROSI|nr:hypothetical protein K2173_026690 [Erythroxylum novogranatense]